MTDFVVTIDNILNQLEIESTIFNTLNIEENNNLLQADSQFGVNSILQIEAGSINNIEINTAYAGTVVFASDIIGLDNYLSDFIDSYEIDCGSP